ncbi:MAG: acetoacetate--CoA ligase [Acidobacteria bacterium]|nr:acetoacetate--CoA ligase [Acidobacteriota bacterium]MBA3887139.1 acetoacetate--CoA ligase [Acidobacteriota bacterium]
MDAPLWTPSPARVERARLTAFSRHVQQQWDVDASTYDALYRFSIERPAEFWRSIWEFSGVIGDMGEQAVVDLDRMPGARFFPDARLNFAENLLRGTGDGPAIIFQGEGLAPKTLSWAGLRAEVAVFAAALRAQGLQPGDRVAAFLPNIPEAVVAALAVAAIGAVWSSCSPDFGVTGVLDRFGQIEPRILITADGYLYGGKSHDSLAKAGEVVRSLPTVERVVVVPYVNSALNLEGVPGAVLWNDFTAGHHGTPLTFEQLTFDHPLYILYSSGTTGIPKCIVHGAGGTLIQHLKEHQLHCDIHPGDRVFYFTTLGWMMWNWLVTVLASEATVLLYDGSPFHPNGHVLFDLADAHGMTLFGTSAKFIDALNKADVAPIDTHRLDTVRTMTSTGSPLAAESFDYVYGRVKKDLHLASISGGTDIVSCFVGGNPAGPVWRGEIQGRALGMKVEVFDDDGRPLPPGAKGELVCTMPFPSMPVGFWNDPDGRKYHAAYFDTWPGVWRHGDYVELTSRGGMIIYGRSDAVLNPGGVRIGTAEIYRQVEQLDEVLESLVIGQQWDRDERVVLFVRLRDDMTLSPELEDLIRRQIRASTTPRHVPARIVQVPEIPRTKSGKIVELAVRDVVHGRPVKNREALANPSALEHFRDRPELSG